MVLVSTINGVHAVEAAGHAFEHHQFGALDVDLAERRAVDVVDQLVEAPHRHPVVAQYLALAGILEHGRGLYVGPDLDVDLAVAVAQRHLMDAAVQLPLEQTHVVQRLGGRVDQVIEGLRERLYSSNVP